MKKQKRSSRIWAQRRGIRQSWFKRCNWSTTSRPLGTISPLGNKVVG